MSEEKKCLKIIKVPKNFAMVHGHGTQVVVVGKLETAEQDRLLKKAIKEDYKNVFRDVLVVREDEIKKKHFINISRGRSVSAVEVRTFIPNDSYEILRTTFAPTMCATKDAYLNNKVYPNEKSK